MASEAQKRAIRNYESNNIDKITLRLSKGQKDIIAEHAAKHGESLNGFIKRAISETMEQDNKK